MRVGWRTAFQTTNLVWRTMLGVATNPGNLRQIREAAEKSDRDVRVHVLDSRVCVNDTILPSSKSMAFRLMTKGVLDFTVGKKASSEELLYYWSLFRDTQNIKTLIRLDPAIMRLALSGNLPNSFTILKSHWANVGIIKAAVGEHQYNQIA